MQNYKVFAVLNIARDKYSACISINNNDDKYYADGIKPMRKIKIKKYIIRI